MNLTLEIAEVEATHVASHTDDGLETDKRAAQARHERSALEWFQSFFYYLHVDSSLLSSFKASS